MDNITAYLNQIINDQPEQATQTLDTIIKERVKQRFSTARKIAENHLSSIGSNPRKYNPQAEKLINDARVQINYLRKTGGDVDTVRLDLLHALDRLHYDYMSDPMAMDLISV
jgi:hypothetical protein